MSDKIDVKKLVDEAMNGKKPEYTGPKMVYDENGHRLGLTNFEEVQIETLGFQSLGEKVTRILDGSMDFHSREDVLEYDQEEGSWSDEDPDFDPTNELLDKTDIHDLHKELIEKQREVQQKLTSITKVEPGDNPASEQSSQQAPSDSAAAESQKTESKN